MSWPLLPAHRDLSEMSASALQNLQGSALEGPRKPDLGPLTASDPARFSQQKTLSQTAIAVQVLA